MDDHCQSKISFLRVPGGKRKDCVTADSSGKRCRKQDPRVQKLRDDFVYSLVPLSDEIEDIIKISRRLHSCHIALIVAVDRRYINRCITAAVKTMNYQQHKCLEIGNPYDWNNVQFEDTELVLFRDPFGVDTYDKEKTFAMIAALTGIQTTIDTGRHETVTDVIIVTGKDNLEECKKHFNMDLLNQPLFLCDSNKDLCRSNVESSDQVYRNLLGQSQCYIEEYRGKYKNQKFISDAQNILGLYNFVVLSGSRRSGKNTLAFAIIPEDKISNVLVLSEVDELKYLKFNDTFAVIIEDIGGKQDFNQAEALKWYRKFDMVYACAKAGKIKVIITIEESVLETWLKTLPSHRMLEHIIRIDPDEKSTAEVDIIQQHIIPLHPHERNTAEEEMNLEHHSRLQTEKEGTEVEMKQEDAVPFYQYEGDTRNAEMNHEHALHLQPGKRRISEVDMNQEHGIHFRTDEGNTNRKINQECGVSFNPDERCTEFEMSQKHVLCLQPDEGTAEVERNQDHGVPLQTDEECAEIKRERALPLNPDERSSGVEMNQEHSMRLKPDDLNKELAMKQELVLPFRSDEGRKSEAEMMQESQCGTEEDIAHDEDVLCHTDSMETVSAEPISSREHCDGRVKATLCGTFDVKCSTDRTLPDIWDICQLVNGLLVMTDFGNKCVKKMDLKYTVTESLNVPGLPIGVCQVDKENIAVALWDKKKIQFVYLTEQMALSAKSFHVGDNCSGIACTRDLLYVSFGGKQKYRSGTKGRSGHVEVFDFFGTKIAKYDEGFSCPEYIYFDNVSSKIFITDAYIGLITEEQKGIFQSRSYDMLKSPAGMCRVSGGQLCVAGYSSNNVVVVSDSGHGYQLLSLDNPAGLCYDENRCRLVVTMAKSRVVKVFTLSFEKV